MAVKRTVAHQNKSLWLPLCYRQGMVHNCTCTVTVGEGKKGRLGMRKGWGATSGQGDLIIHQITKMAFRAAGTGHATIPVLLHLSLPEKESARNCIRFGILDLECWAGKPRRYGPILGCCDVTDEGSMASHGILLSRTTGSAARLQDR
jgi:hypothetical protein